MEGNLVVSCFIVLEEVLVASKEWEMEEQRRRIASYERAVADRGLDRLVGDGSWRSRVLQNGLVFLFL